MLREFPSLRASRPFKKNTSAQWLSLFQLSHGPRNPSPSLALPDAMPRQGCPKQPPETLLADQTSTSVQTRAEIRRELSLTLFSHHIQTGLPVHSLPGIFKVKLISAPSSEVRDGDQGCDGNGTTPRLAHNRGRKSRAQKTSQGDSVSSKARNTKPAPQQRSTRAGRRQRGPACYSLLSLERGRG